MHLMPVYCSFSLKLDLPSPFPFYGHMVHTLHVFPAFGVVSVDHMGLNFVTHGR